MNNFALGKYLPLNSPIHRMDPRAKIMAMLIVLIAILWFVLWQHRRLQGSHEQLIRMSDLLREKHDELLKKNADMLKVATIETAKESERGIIDIETLVQTNQSLIDTINEVMTIQQEGHTKRVEAEKTLYQMENDL